MPLCQSILGQAVVDSIVAEVIKPSLLHTRCFWVPVNVTQGIQRSALITFGKSGTVIALLPKVACTVEHPIEAHRRVPVEPMHDSGQIIRLLRFQQIMHMVAHDAETIELEAIFDLASLNRKQQHFATFKSSQAKFAIVATSRDVIAKLGLEFTRLSGHKL